MNEHWDPALEGRIRRAKRGKEQIQEFVVEQATDPLNYVPFGATAKGAKLAAKGLFGLAGAKLAEEAEGTVLGPNRIPKSVLDSIVPPTNRAEHAKVFKETGVHYKQGKPDKYYVPDTGAKLVGDMTKLSEKAEPITKYFDNPDVFGAVPELRDVKIQVYPGLDADTRAAFSPKNNLVLINPKFMSDPERLLQSIIHEVQHAAQIADKRPSGGDPTKVMADVRKTWGGVMSEKEMYDTAKDLYRGLPGEKEARLAQKWNRTDLRKVPEDQYITLDELMSAETQNREEYLSPFYSDPFKSTIR